MNENSEQKEGALPLAISELEDSLGYTFKDRSHLERALTHSSIIKTAGKDDYERLEFLGDAVIDLVIAHMLIEVYPESKEGELSKMRAALVNTSSLADIARSVSLGKFIKLSKSELSSGGADRTSLLADVFEAIIGAIYRDGTFDACFGVIYKFFGDKLKSVTPRDPKTELQEALHLLGSVLPVYTLENVEGPEHAPQFVSAVTVAGEILGRGKGATKKASQQIAAAEALQKIEPKLAAVKR